MTTRPHAAQSTSPLVVTADPDLLDRVLAVTAAAGVEPLVAGDAGSVRPTWSSASVIIAGVDQAPGLASMVLPRRAEVYVVGDDAARDEVMTWSVPLGAAVVLLPSGASWLTTAIADLSGLGGGGGSVMAVVGGNGGVGASTLAAALAFVAGTRRLRSLLVDADPLGGGLDLLVGAERVEGWRWPRLASAQGHLGDLSPQLPKVDGFDLLSAGRGPDEDLSIGIDPMKAVLTSVTRSHDLVLVDLPRELPAPAREVMRRADVCLLVASATVRGMAAAGQMAAQLADASNDLRMVVRSPRSGGIEPELVAESLDLPLLATVHEDARLRLGVERGDPPGRSPRSQLAGACRQILDSLGQTTRRAA